MDESCVVCADPLEWVAYGACGHREVCAVCIARLRCVCHDQRCCICKSLSPSLFVTRALGSLTRVINDFSILPADAKDGKLGSYWFHEGIQAYFDDFDAYKIIKAMCTLSCSVCDKTEAEGKRASKRRGKFKSIEQLQEHVSRQHELFFCSLCLRYKKVFICEQKLYSRVQLRRHISCGDSEVDGSEDERGGFSGHPLCEFCETPFYDDNELYLHMSTEHFTCHICKRQHTSRYEYYSDYKNLENHFREAHYLCEENTCLEQKFIVFASEAEMKRHAALEHGGNMSRSKRFSALQLPTGFRTQEREAHHHTRAHFCAPGVSGQEVSSASSATAVGTSSNFLHDASSTVQRITGHSGTSEIGSTASLVPSSGNQGTALDFRGVLLRGPDFPPLVASSKRKRRKSKKSARETGSSTTELHVIPSSSGSSSSQSRGSSSNAGPVLQCNPAVLSQSRPLADGHSTPFRSVNPPSLLTLTSNRICSVSSANMLSNSISQVGSSSSAIDREGPSAHGEPSLNEDDIQAANKALVEKIRATLEFDHDKFAAFKIISKEYREDEIDAREYLAYINQFGLAHLILDLARLCPEPQKQKELMEIYKTSLKDVNENGPRRESRKGSASKNPVKGKVKCEDSESTAKGVALPHNLVRHGIALKLNAKPCNEEPVSSKVGDHFADGKSMTRAVAEISEILTGDAIENGMRRESGNRSESKHTMKGKERCEDGESSSKEEVLPDNILNHMKALKLIDTHYKEEPSSSQGVDHSTSRRSQTSVVNETSEILSAASLSKDVGCANEDSNCFAKETATKDKKKLKKSSKFLKNRLGENAASLITNPNSSDLPSDLLVVRPNQDSILASVRGVWRNDGGRRLVTLSEATPSTR